MRVIPGLVLALLCALAEGAIAQTFPARPLRIVVPFPAGVADTLARQLAPPLGAALGQPAIVDNKPGASGQIAAQEVLRAPPDGHALFLGHIGTHALNPHLFRKLAYDADRDFAPVTLLITTPNLLIVHPALAATTVTELLRLAREKPGALSYGSPGNGSSGHLAAELLKALGGVDIVHVPYKGAAQALQDLVGGRIQLMFDTLTQGWPQAKAGKVRALAVASPERHPAAPDVPTMDESGFPGWDTGPWFGLFVRAGTDKAVIHRLHEDAVKALADPVLRERFTALGATVVGSTPDEFATFIASERTRWGKVIREANIQVE